MIAVIGCGNPLRGDDGAGGEVIRRPAGRLGDCGEAVRLIDAGTSGLAVLYRMRGADHVVIVDASRSGSEAGAVLRLPGREAQTQLPPGIGLHGLRWDHALYAGAQMLGEGFLEGPLARCPAMALLAREGRWLLFPVMGGAGGLGGEAAQS